MLGIVGGMGPESTSKFYLDLIGKFRKKTDVHPSIVIDNIPFPFFLEKEIIQKSKNEEKLLPFIIESVKRLERTGVDFIVIPCNTAHIFMEELRTRYKVPILNMIEETVKEIKRENYKKVGLLATTKTVDSKLYQNPLENSGIDVILPTKKEQDDVSRIIIEILRNKVTDENKKTMKKLVDDLTGRGSEAIVLGCAELQTIIKQEDFDTEILDSMKILSESVFKKMTGE